MAREELDRARGELERAGEHATGVVQEQVESIAEGILEEDEGETTREEPGPKVDRIAELAQKLDGLADEVDDAAVGEHVAAARDHLRGYMHDHPQGG